MSEYKQIPGVETRFSAAEIKVLVDHFQCKNVVELMRAAKRYESLFFMFTAEENGIDIYPGEDMRLALALAEHCVFENFSNTDEPLQRRYSEKSKRGPGRSRRVSLPEDLPEKLKEARKVVSTNEDAVNRLKALGAIPKHARSLKPKSILKYIQKSERERAEREREKIESYLRAEEAFKDFAPPAPQKSD